MLPHGNPLIGVTDDFFELGGDTIHVVQIAEELHRAFDVRGSLKAIFDYNTIRELAAASYDVLTGSKVVRSPNVR